MFATTASCREHIKRAHLFTARFPEEGAPPLGGWSWRQRNNRAAGWRGAGARCRESTERTGPASGSCSQAVRCRDTRGRSEQTAARTEGGSEGDSSGPHAAGTERETKRRKQAITSMVRDSINMFGRMIIMDTYTSFETCNGICKVHKRKMMHKDTDN